MFFNLKRYRYIEANFINNIGRPEDIPLGINMFLRGGTNLGNGKKSFNYSSSISLELSAGNISKYYNGIRISASGYQTKSNFRDLSLSVSNLSFYRISKHHLITLKFSGVNTLDWSPRRQLILDSRNGLRGFNANVLKGKHHYIMNIEERLYSSRSFSIFNIGGALFFDGAFVSNDPVPNIDTFYSSIGLGIRLENSKQLGRGITRIDVVYNINDKEFKLILTNGHLFSSYFSPNY